MKLCQTRSCLSLLLFALLLVLVETYDRVWAAQCSLDPGVAARGCLENPTAGTSLSGIGVLSGWVCQARHVVLEIDGRLQLEAGYGTERTDTQMSCGDTNNGFGLLYNLARLGEGPHTVRALADGQEFGRAAFVVATLGQEFVRGLDGQSFPVTDFPEAGQTVTVVWQEGAQNFAIRGDASTTGGQPSLNSRARLENPGAGSFQSGLSVVSGWVCEATTIELVVDNTIHWQAAYGTTREDTQGVCGDTNNGFGYLTNWNKIGAGVHQLRAYADGQEFGNAMFVVTTLGEEFRRGLSKETAVGAFPAAQQQTQVQWQQSVQNFVVSGATFPGARTELCTTRPGTAVNGGQQAAVQWRNPCLLSGNTSEVRFQAPTRQAVRSAEGRASAASQDGFLLCKDSIEIEQDGQLFGASDFRLLDQEGNEVTGCVSVLLGTDITTFLQVNATSRLNFNAPFVVRYNQQTILEFTAPEVSNPPILIVTPLRLEFMPVDVEQSDDQTFTVQNTGGSTLLGGMTLIGAGSGGSEGVFSLPSPMTLNLAPGQPPQEITVRYTPQNTGPRQGSVRISTNAGVESVELVEGAQDCQYMVSPLAPPAFTAGGGSGAITVTTTPETGCQWTAESNAPWLTITAGGAGSGTGTVSYNVAANPNGTARTGMLTVARATVTVTQSGAGCTATLTPSSASFDETGGTDSVDVTIPNGCSWDAVANDPWLTVTGGAPGNGNGTVSYSVAANPDSTSRTGTLTIAGQTFTVTQSGALCTPTFTPTNAFFDETGGTDSVDVTIPNGCSWDAVANDPWLTVTGGAPGNGNGTVSYSVAANPDSTSRTGTLTIASQTFTVMQSGAPCTATLTPSSASFDEAGGTGSVDVAIPAGCPWDAVANDPWLTVTGGTPGNGNGTVSYSVDANTDGTPRTGTLTIAGQTFTVTQSGAPCNATLTPTSAQFTTQGGTGSVDVTIPNGCPWDAVANDSWLTVTFGTPGNGAGTVSYSVEAGGGCSGRTGTLTIANQTFTVTQEAFLCQE